MPLGNLLIFSEYSPMHGILHAFKRITMMHIFAISRIYPRAPTYSPFSAMTETFSFATRASSDDSKTLMLYHTRYMIYLLVSFIAALTAYHLVFLVSTNVAYHPSGQHTSELEKQDVDRRPHASRTIHLRRVPAAILSTFRILFCRVSLPTTLGSHYCLGDSLVIAGYFAALLSFEFINGTVTFDIDCLGTNASFP